MAGNRTRWFREECLSRERNRPADGTGITAGTRNHLSKSFGGVFEIAGSEPAEDGLSRVGGTRIKNATGSYQRLLRPAPDRILGKADGKAAGHSGRIKGKLRTAFSAFVPVSELFSLGERKPGSAVTRE